MQNIYELGDIQAISITHELFYYDSAMIMNPFYITKYRVSLSSETANFFKISDPKYL